MDNAAFAARGSLAARQPLNARTSTLRTTASLARHIDWLAADLALNFDKFILHDVNTNQEQIIEDFGSRVLLPELPRIACPEYAR